MNKKSVLITVVMVFLCAFCSVVYGDPWLGSGDANDPYQIHNAQQMQAIGADANYWDAHFLLCADIDLSAYTGTSFNIIGNDVNAFAGVFDGDGHTISNFTYDSNGVDYVGLFGYIYGPNREVKNLGLIDPNIHTNLEFSYTGSLAGYLAEGTVSNCYVEGGYVRGGSCGGLVGLHRVGYITNCYSTASVEGILGGLGGLVGENDGDISDSYSTGSVTGVDKVGGLVGSNIYGDIQRCYSTGSVTGANYVGGLIARNHDGNLVMSIQKRAS